MAGSYTTTFNTNELGGTIETYDLTIFYDEDFNGDGFNDIKVRLTHTSNNSSGTEDTLGVAFDLGQVIPGLTIGQVKINQGTVDPAFVTTGIDYDEVGDGTGFNTQPGLNISGPLGDNLEPFDAFVKVSEAGQGDGLCGCFEFVLSAPSISLVAGLLLDNTDWFIRTTSTGDTGEGSAKTTGTIGQICFLTGTLIATPDGERRVETLKAGDLVLTAEGRTVPVKWMGHQTLFPAFNPAERLRPVRFAAGSLGAGLPHSDLTVTANHGMFVDGVICHAGALVNGTTITRVPLWEMGGSYTVWHIETEAHEIILSNGATSETFIDNVTRRGFDNFAEYEALFGDTPEMAELPFPRAMSPRQVPATIRVRLAERVARQPAEPRAA